MNTEESKAMAIVKVYEVREQRDAERRPENRGYLVALCTSLDEAMSKAEKYDAQGRDVAVYKVWFDAETLQKVQATL